MLRGKLLKYLTVFTITALFISIGYATISNISLRINGSATATYNPTLEVKFSTLSSDISTSSECLSDSGISTNCATITPTSTTERNATFTVTGLKGYGDTAIIRYKILNESVDTDALLNITTVTNTNTEYFSITSDLSNANSQVLESNSDTILTIKIKVIKVLYTGNSMSTNVTVTVNASAI